MSSRTICAALRVCACALMPSLSTVWAQDLSKMTPADAAAASAAAQADGKGLANTQISGAASPSVLIPMGSTPGPNNIMGTQYTGVPDPAQTGLVTNPSLVTTGGAAKTTSVNGFTGYSNDRADQGNQAAYFVTSTPFPQTTINPADPLAVIAKGPEIPTGTPASSSQICTTTVTPVPFDPNIQYICNETYNMYVTSCSLDRTISISQTPVCDPVIGSGTTFNTVTSPPTNGFIGMSHPPSVSCGSGSILTVNLGRIPGSQQCHGGGCNSGYFEFVMNIVRGTPSRSCQWQARIYTGVYWGYMCANYDGANTISIPAFDMAASYMKINGNNCGRNGHSFCTSYTRVKNPGGDVIIIGGHRMQPNVVNGADVDNCISLGGFL